MYKICQRYSKKGVTLQGNQLTKDEIIQRRTAGTREERGEEYVVAREATADCAVEFACYRGTDFVGSDADY